jgi:prophage maintenance system killer protein
LLQKALPRFGGTGGLCEEDLLKRAFAARAFLFRNGYRLEPEELEMIAVVRQRVAGEIGRKDLAGWFEANSRPIP